MVICLDLVFLGTAASIPTPTRSLPSILVDEETLLDCGEGTTQRLLLTGHLSSVKRVFITHSHLDHSAGIATLVWTFWLHGRRTPLFIGGPSYVENLVFSLLREFGTPLERLTFNVEYKQSFENVVFTSVDHHPETFALKIEVGNVKICYSSDTAPCKSLIKLAHGCDVLIHEATFLDDEKHLAHMLKHSTAGDAGKVAHEARVKKLVLFHWPWMLEGREHLLVSRI
ncbi:MAG: MBL fold metallo-hydrolase, partial [Candidatus Freyarchaeota archaeon]|nr:MBL fold metallo-hydrolase [Candidatus Jordarchaeia archaeon]